MDQHEDLVDESFPKPATEPIPAHEGPAMKGGLLTPITRDSPLGKYVIQRNMDKMIKFGKELMSK